MHELSTFLSIQKGYNVCILKEMGESNILSVIIKLNISLRLYWMGDNISGKPDYVSRPMKFFVLKRLKVESWCGGIGRHSGLQNLRLIVIRVQISSPGPCP
jgi:hypothetical protein